MRESYFLFLSSANATSTEIIAKWEVRMEFGWEGGEVREKKDKNFIIKSTKQISRINNYVFRVMCGSRALRLSFQGYTIYKRSVRYERRRVRRRKTWNWRETCNRKSIAKLFGNWFNSIIYYPPPTTPPGMAMASTSMRLRFHFINPRIVYAYIIDEGL